MLDEWHPLTASEISTVSQKPGVYVLYRVQIPVHVDGGGNLREALRAAKTRFPGATHFSVELCEDSTRLRERLAKLRKELRSVRALAFGPTPTGSL